MLDIEARQHCFLVIKWLKVQGLVEYMQTQNGISVNANENVL